MTTLAGVQQVHLQVRVAEVSRTAIRALGINAFMTGNSAFGGSTIGPDSGGAINPVNIGVPSGTSTTGQLPFQFTSPVGVTPPVTLFGGFNAANLEIFLQALAENQYLRLWPSRAWWRPPVKRPTSWSAASTPFPWCKTREPGRPRPSQSNTRNTAFGSSSSPPSWATGASCLVAPEVSERTDVGAVVIQGFSVSAPLTRRAQTTLEMHSGQTFGMAGLINHTVDARSSKTPGLGDLPGLALFRSVRYVRGETDLVVLVTANLVEPTSDAVTPPLPGITHRDPNDWEALRPGAGRSQHARPDFAGSMQVAQAIGPEPAARSRRVGLLRSRGHRRDL